MPGLLGHATMPQSVADLGVGLQKLLHFASYRSSVHTHSPAVQIGHVLRGNSNATQSVAVSPDGRIAVHLTGHLRRPQKPYGAVWASNLLDAYLRGRLDPNALDGGFICCIVDLRRGTLEIFNDRLGTLPVLHAKTERGFAFAPEAKALWPILEFRPTLTDAGMVSFLSAGYCLGEQTLFQGIHFLEPATRLKVDLRDLSVSAHRYWKIDYEENAELANPHAAVAALDEAILDSHDIVLDSSAVPFDILLSGGHDSRCMLASAVREGRVPKRAFGWGARDDIPFSDPVIARLLAKRFGVSFEFFRYDIERFTENASRWCRISELANDNIGWYAEGASVLEESYDSSVAYTLVGDEAWGWGGAPRDRDQAIAAVVPQATPRLFKRLAHAESLEMCDAHYSQSIEHVLRPSQGHGFAEQKDFLYLHGRVARFIFSLGYYKELATQVRRPFLTRAVLEVIRRLPRQLRYHKNLYRLVLARRFPELRGVPINLNNSLPNWKYEVRHRPDLREFFSSRLSGERLERSAVSRLLDPSAVAQAWNEHLQNPVRADNPRISGLRLLKYRLIPESLKIRRARRGEDLGGIEPRSDFELFRALALLMLLEEQFPALGSSRPEQETSMRVAPLS